MPEIERKRVPGHRSGVVKRSPPQSPSVHPRNTEDPRAECPGTLARER